MIARPVTLVLAWLALATGVQAGTYVLSGDTADYGIAEGSPPTVIAASGSTIRVGANSNTTPDGGRNAVLIFGLPVIPSIEDLASAQLVFDVAGKPGSPTFNGDLWGIGFQTSSGALLEYFEADTGDAGNTKLADNPANEDGFL